jgi:hypothetical protein
MRAYVFLWRPDDSTCAVLGSPGVPPPRSMRGRGRGALIDAYITWE